MHPFFTKMPLVGTSHQSCSQMILLLGIYRAYVGSHHVRWKFEWTSHSHDIKSKALFKAFMQSVSLQLCLVCHAMLLTHASKLISHSYR